MSSMYSRLVILSGSASGALTEEICDYILKKEASLSAEERLPSQLVVGKAETKRFSDGETFVKIDSNVRGADVFVVQSTNTPANDHLMELFLLMDALRRASALRVTAVIPYFGYARQDRKEQGRVALSAKLVANLITKAGADRLLTKDLHAGQLEGFFDIPVDLLYAGPVLIRHVSNLNLTNPVVVSPDVGNVKLTRYYAERLNYPMAIVDKRRPRPNECQVMTVIGEINGHDCLIFDDMIDTAGTIVGAAAALLERGARRVIACCTHPVLSGPALDRLRKSSLEKVVVTNTIPPAREWEGARITQVSVAPMFGEAIRRIHKNESISKLFEWDLGGSNDNG